MTGDPTITRTEIETRDGSRPVLIVEWDHPGGGRGGGSRGRHRAIILAEPGEGEGAIARIERQDGADALGIPKWTGMYTAPPTYLVAVMLRAGMLREVSHG